MCVCVCGVLSLALLPSFFLFVSVGLFLSPIQQQQPTHFLGAFATADRFPVREKDVDDGFKAIVVPIDCCRFHSSSSLSRRSNFRVSPPFIERPNTNANFLERRSIAAQPVAFCATVCAGRDRSVVFVFVVVVVIDLGSSVW